MDRITLHEGEMSDANFGRAIFVGIAVGVAMMFIVATGMVYVGGQSIGLSAGIAVWVGCVIGPYAGGLTMLSRADAKAHRSPSVHEVEPGEDIGHIAA